MNPLFLNRRPGDNKAAVLEGFCIFDTGNLVAFCSFAALVEEPVVSRNNEMCGIGAGSKPPDQPHDFVHSLLAGVENLILRAGFVSMGVNLILIHIDNLFTGEDLPQLSYFQGLDIVQLHTYALWAMAL